MKAITLRNVPRELERVILQRVRRTRASINKAVISLLEEAAGLGKGRPTATPHHDLDNLWGAWSAEEARAFDRHLASQRAIDADLWR